MVFVLVSVVINPRALLGQPTKEKREEGGRIRQAPHELVLRWT
jgi:hypothetical protein